MWYHFDSGSGISSHYGILVATCSACRASRMIAARLSAKQLFFAMLIFCLQLWAIVLALVSMPFFSCFALSPLPFGSIGWLLWPNSIVIVKTRSLNRLLLFLRELLYRFDAGYGGFALPINWIWIGMWISRGSPNIIPFLVIYSFQALGRSQAVGLSPLQELDSDALLSPTHCFWRI